MEPSAWTVAGAGRLLGLYGALALGLLLSAPVRAADTDPADMLFWESVKNSSDPTEYKAYLEAFPNGRFAPLARLRAGAAPDTATPKVPPGGQPADDGGSAGAATADGQTPAAVTTSDTSDTDGTP